MIGGECNCGAIRYEADAEPAGVFICHCSICRRHTGTNGNAVVIVPRGDFRWTQGEDGIASWQKPGHDWQIWFCRECGSQLPGEDSETMMFIPVGSLTHGAEGLEVIHHIWVDSRAGWDVIGDAGKQHPEKFRGA